MVRYQALKGLYETERTIGCGGFAKVKLATHLATGEKVAIKIMNKSVLGDDLHRVKLELEALKTFSHEHICQLYQIVETESHFFIVMEYCSGGELFDHIVEKSRLTESESRMFFRQIVSAVAYLHSLGYAHRDLKPENVLLDKYQNLKLIDFGLCAKPEGGMGNPLFTSCGSPTYAAPELVLGKQYLGQEVDVWAMGVLLYALLTGSLPFDDANIDNLYKKILSGKYAEPPFITKQSVGLIRSMLQVDPKKRVKVTELLSHPWLTLGILEPVDFSSRNCKKYDSGCAKAMAKHLGVDVTSLWEDLSKWKYDYHTATYFLLMCRKKRGDSLRLSPFCRLLAINGDVTQPEKPTKRVLATITNSHHEDLSLSPRHIVQKRAARTPSRPRHVNVDAIVESENDRISTVEDVQSPPAKAFLEPKGPASARKALKRARSPVHDEASPVPSKKATPGKLTPKTPERKRVHSNSDTPGSAKRMLGSIERSLHRVRHAFTPKRGTDNSTPLQPILLNNKDLFNVSTTQCKDPELVARELYKGLEKRGITCTRKGFTLKGNLEPNSSYQFGGCSFELEICYLPTLGLPESSVARCCTPKGSKNNHQETSNEIDSRQNSYFVGIRRKRLKGDSWCYKKVCEQILALTSTGFNNKSLVMESAV